MGDTYNLSAGLGAVASVAAAATDVHPAELRFTRGTQTSLIATITIVSGRIRYPTSTGLTRTPTPRQRLLLVDAVTGKVAYEFPFLKQSWDAPINDVGSISTTIPILATLQAMTAQGADVALDTLRAVLLGPTRWCFVVVYGSTAIWGGPYLAATDGDASSGDSSQNVGVIVATGKQLEWFLSRRLLVDATPGNTASWSDESRDVIFADTNPAAAVLSIVLHAISTFGGDQPTRALPITCTDPPERWGSETFTYLAYDEVDAWKAVSDLVARDDGPDVRLEPILVEGDDGLYVVWDLQIGSPYLPASGTSGDDGALPWTFNDTTAKIARTADAVGLTSTQSTVGDGQDRDKIIVRDRSDQLTGLGFPVLESVDTSTSSETDPYKLDRRNTATLAAHQAPTDAWAVSAPASGGDVQLGQYRRGDLARLDVRRQLLIEPGYYYRRIIAISGDETDRVVLTCDYDDHGGLL